jgi:hypothetical protein
MLVGMLVGRFVAVVGRGAAQVGQLIRLAPARHGRDFVENLPHLGSCLRAAAKLGDQERGEEYE